MRRYISLAFLAAAFAPTVWGQTLTDGRVPGMSQADVHNPFSSRYTPMTPDWSFGRYWPGAGTSYSRSNYYSYGNSGYSYGYGGYGYGPGYYGDGFYPPPYGYGASYGYGGSFATYPLIIPAEANYGLGPIMRMMGGIAPSPLGAPVGPNMVLPNAPLAAGPNLGAANPGAQVAPGPLNQQEPPPANPPLRVRASNAEQLARAGRYLGSGDVDFARQEYREANQNYRKATETAPDLVPAFLRQGQALLAIGQYDLAVKAFKRGLKLGPGWSKADFSLLELYGENKLAQQNHMEALAAAAGDQPQNADLLLLVGMELHFGGQQARAVQFFQKFAALLPDEGLNLAEVLK